MRSSARCNRCSSCAPWHDARLKTIPHRVVVWAAIVGAVLAVVALCRAKVDIAGLARTIGNTASLTFIPKTEPNLRVARTNPKVM